MTENFIQASGAAAAATTEQAPTRKDSAASGGQSAGSLFFEMLSNSLAGGLAMQATRGVASEFEGETPAGENRATFRNRQENQNQVMNFEREETASREIRKEQELRPEEKQFERPKQVIEKQSGRPANAAEKQDTKSEAARSASDVKTKGVSEETGSAKPKGAEPARETAVKQPLPKPSPETAVKQPLPKPPETAVKQPQPLSKTGGEVSGDSNKPGAENTLKETKPVIEIKQPAPQVVKAPAVEVGKPGDVSQQSTVRNAVIAGMARQVQEAPKPSNVIDIAQLINRAAAKTAQESVQPSANSQGTQSGGDPPAGQSSQAALLMTMVNSATSTQAQAGASTFAAVMQQSQSPATARPAAQPSANMSQVATPMGPAAAARGAESAARTAEAAPARQPMPAERVINQVIRAARISVDQGRGEIKMLLKPESLGWLKIKISVADQNVTARITVEHEGVRELLEGNIKQLQQALSQQNLKVTQIVVELNSDAEKQAPQSGPGDGRAKGSKISIAGEGAEAELALAQPAEEALKRGTVDLRV
ncbi:MAG TPA: flagellar hook-length control protein FliK [Acidobacteriota bacterium]|nr:flagellar hook-length control protein FliK [Acidobacteriota bacterium]